MIDSSLRFFCAPHSRAFLSLGVVKSYYFLPLRFRHYCNYSCLARCESTSLWGRLHLTSGLFNWLHFHLLNTFQALISQMYFHLSTNRLSSIVRRASFNDHFLPQALMTLIALIFHRKGSKTSGRIFRKIQWPKLNLRTL